MGPAENGNKMELQFVSNTVWIINKITFNLKLNFLFCELKFLTFIRSSEISVAKYVIIYLLFSFFVLSMIIMFVAFRTIQNYYTIIYDTVNCYE